MDFKNRILTANILPSEAEYFKNLCVLVSSWQTKSKEEIFVDQIASSTPDAQKIELKGMTPSVIIGVGGTGAKVLMGIRRKIIENYETLGNLPGKHLCRCR